jgi:glycosyltransferase involved in cell wall biosynthesis
MNIGIISLADGEASGGCEFLWQDMSLVALKQKHNVRASISYNKEITINYTYLKTEGIFFHTRYKYFKLFNNIIRFIHQFIFKQKINFFTQFLFFAFNPYHRFFNQKLDIILINCPLTYEILTNHFLLIKLKKSNVPYILLSHLHLDYGFPNNWNYKKARQVLQSAKAVLFVSQRNLKTVERQIVLKLKNTHIVRNPINRKSNTYIPYPKNDTIYKMAIVGRLNCNHKGLDIIIEVLSSEIWQQREWQLNIFGIGYDKEYLEAYIQSKNLQNKIYLRGFQSVEKIWRENQILLLPSLHEGMPLVVVEAMISGRTVVSNNVGGISEWINNTFGFISKSPLSEDFTICLENAWKKREHWEKYGLDAREVALNKYSPNPGKDLLEIIKFYIDEK